MISPHSCNLRPLRRLGCQLLRQRMDFRIGRGLLRFLSDVDEVVGLSKSPYTLACCSSPLQMFDYDPGVIGTFSSCQYHLYAY